MPLLTELKFFPGWRLQRFRTDGAEKSVRLNESPAFGSTHLGIQMEKHSKQIFGVILIVAGLALTVLGVKMLFGPNQYSATVRVFTVSDHSGGDDPNFDPRRPTRAMYDPYFIQTKFELIQSHLVLSNVVLRLALNQKWGERTAGGSALTVQQSMTIIKKYLTLSPVKGYHLISLAYTSADPNEAALIANAIADGYLDFYIERQKRYLILELKVWQKQLQAAEEQIPVMQTNVERLGKQFEIQNDTVTNQLPEQQPYWDARQRLEAMLKSCDVLKQKIIDEELESKNPKFQMVQIVDRAEPPKSPSSPNRMLGAVEAALGLVFLCGGTFLLKPARD
jgi:uncharacterized protein involved in exopolysaccharide biosynthesis